MSRFHWALSGDSFLDNGLSGWRTLIDAFASESASTLYIPGGLSESERLLIEKGCGACAPLLLGKGYSGGLCHADRHDCAGIISFAPARSLTFPSSYGGKRVAAVGGMDPCDWSRQIEASRNYGVDLLLSELLPDEIAGHGILILGALGDDIDGLM